MNFRKFAMGLIILVSLGWIQPHQPAAQAQPVELAALGSRYRVTITELNLDSNDLVYDAARNTIYASVPGSSGSNQNSILPISVPDAAPGPAIAVGGEPNKLAISDDGQYLYVGLDGVYAIRRVDLATKTAGLQFDLGFDLFGAFVAEDMVVLKNQPGSIAVSKMIPGFSPRHFGVSIFDEGVERPTSTPQSIGSNVIEPSETESTIFGYNNESSEFGFRVMSIDGDGVSIASTTPDLISGFNVDIRSSQGLVYSTRGVVVNPDTLSIVGTYPVSLQEPQVVPDPANDRVYFLGHDGTPNSARVSIYDHDSFSLIGDVVLSNVSGYPKSFIQTGKDTFAFRTSDGFYASGDHIYLLKLEELKSLFLPLAKKGVQMPGIFGLVTQGGAPAAGVPLELRHFNGSSWSILMSSATDANGRYSFEPIYSLMDGQSLRVVFLNDSDPSRLGVWVTRILDKYTVGDSVNIGDFDIANVEMLQPAPGATAALPTTFQWGARSATPSDRYELNLFDYTDGDPYFYTNPPLGFTSQYTLNSLPPGGFEYGAVYGWNMGVLSPDGGYGNAYWIYGLVFSQSPQMGMDALQGAPLWQVKTPSAAWIDKLPGR